MSITKDWFQVDRKGLAALLERKGKSFALFELVQNAWDENGVSRVDVNLHAIEDERMSARLVVTDDAPDGFADLTHSYTLFAPSKKKGDATKRGRFNLGEKLFLAMCREARVVSTTGGVRFDEDGRHAIRTKALSGTTVNAVLKLSREEIQQITADFRRLIPPIGICTTLNGEPLMERVPLRVVECSLITEIGNHEGQLVTARRTCNVEIYEPHDGETACLYEMGIPVVETDDRWHVNITQKVPLTMDRENVSPSYLKAVRVAVLNAMHEWVTPEAANQKWAVEAMTSRDVTPAAADSFVTAKFGPKRVAYDPSDPEANKLAVSEGYVVIHGGALSSQAWSTIRSNNLVLPAGQVTPSPKPYSEHGRAVPDFVPSDEMIRVERHAQRIARLACGGKIVNVRWKCDVSWRVAATCGPDGTLTFNVGSLGKAFFDLTGNRERIDALIIHEFGHLYSLDHLSREYYDALCSIGARYAAACGRGEFSTL